VLATWAWLLACDGRTNHHRPPSETATAPIPTETGATPPALTKDPTPTREPIADTWQLCDETVRVPWDGYDAPPAADPDQPIAGVDPTPTSEHLGWPSSDPSTSVSFVWRTAVDVLETEVSWGTTAPDQVAIGASYVIDADTQPPGTRIHEVKLCGKLSPSTSYQYKVGGPDGWSATHRFTSGPVPGSAAGFRFAYLGDSRGPPEIFGQVLALADAEDPDFFLFGGDLVSTPGSLSLWDGWFGAAGDIIARRPFITAHGNHESLEQSYFAMFSLPGNEQWYGIRYGNLTLAVLNDTVADQADLAGAEVDLMNAAFGAYPNDFKVVMHHQAEYASCSTHASNLNLRTTWAPVYDAQEVGLVLEGHNHAYERSVPISGDALVAQGKGTVYLVSGGAGAPLYKRFDDEWFTAEKAAVYHYVIADVFADRMDLTAKDVDGNAIDSFSVPLR
jgi:hypothetical protein